MKFENKRAKQYYDEITNIHGITISAPSEMIFTEKDMWDNLINIYRKNYKGFIIET